MSTVPISDIQRALSDPSVLVAAAVAFEGAVRLPEVTLAVHELCRRHPALRTTVDLAQGTQTEHAYRAEAVDLQVVPVRRAHFIEDMTPHALGEIDPSRLPLFRCVVGTEGDDVVGLQLAGNHALSDRGSLQLLFDEMFALMRAHRAGAPPPRPSPGRPFGEWLAERHARLRDPATWQPRGPGQRALTHWEHVLKGAPLPGWARPDGPPQGPTTTGFIRVTLDGVVREGLARLAADAGASLLHVLIAAYQEAVARTTGQSDVTAICLVHGRGKPDMRKTVGMLVEEVVVRDQVDGTSCTERVRRVREAVLRAYLHLDVPLAALTYRSRTLAAFYVRRRYGGIVLQYRPQRIVVPELDPLPGVIVRPVREMDGMAAWRLPGHAVLSVDDDGETLDVELMFDMAWWVPEELARLLDEFREACERHGSDDVRDARG